MGILQLEAVSLRQRIHLAMRLQWAPTVFRSQGTPHTRVPTMASRTPAVQLHDGAPTRRHDDRLRYAIPVQPINGRLAQSNNSTISNDQHLYRYPNRTTIPAPNPRAQPPPRPHPPPSAHPCRQPALAHQQLHRHSHFTYWGPPSHPSTKLWKTLRSPHTSSSSTPTQPQHQQATAHRSPNSWTPSSMAVTSTNPPCSTGSSQFTIGTSPKLQWAPKTTNWNNGSSYPSKSFPNCPAPPVCPGPSCLDPQHSRRRSAWPSNLQLYHQIGPSAPNHATTHSAAARLRPPTRWSLSYPNKAQAGSRSVNPHQSPHQ